MKELHFFTLALCLCACQAASKPSINPSPSAFSSMPSTFPGRVQKAQQELDFPVPRNTFHLHFNEDGNGVLLTGGGLSMEPLGLQSIKNFILQEPLQNYPSIAGVALAAQAVFMNQQGQGQVIAVNTTSPTPPGGVMPAVEIPPQNKSLELRTVAIQGFKPTEAPEVFTFQEKFSSISLRQVLVNESGNGYLSLQVLDPVSETTANSSKPLPRIIFVPIQAHRVQPTLESALNLSGIPGQITGVWLNADKDGLVLYRQEPEHWFIRLVEKGQLGSQIVDLGGRLRMAAPDLQLDANGNGHIYLVQANGQQVFYPLKNFIPGASQILPVPTLPPETFAMADFQGEQGIVVEIPTNPVKGSVWNFQVYHVFQGRQIQSQTLTYHLGPDQFPGLGFQVRVTSHGDGLLTWSTLQQGGSNGKIHFQALENFQLTGQTNWSTAVSGLPTATPMATPAPANM